MTQSETQEKCSYDPRTIPPEAPIGMFHCPECGDMVIAGLPHPPPDPELDALSWNPTAEEADAYLRGHGIIKKCEHCGQDATLTNNFVTHLLARFSERMKEADNAATQMRDACVVKVGAMRNEWQEQADARRDPDAPYDYKGSYGLATGSVVACDDIIEALSSLTLEVKQGGN